MTTSSTENGSTTAVYGQVGRDKEWRAGSKPAPTESIFTARARLERIDGSNNAWLVRNDNTKKELGFNTQPLAVCV